MGSTLGRRGRRAAFSARIAVILGAMCVAAGAVTLPALADDADGASPHSVASGADSDSDSADLPTSPPPPPPDPNAVKGTPCTKFARACVDLASQRGWLFDATGAVARGPVPLSSGGPGQETPMGTFKVLRKDPTHVSASFKGPDGKPAPMPWSVFFTSYGVALHGGVVTRASAGCVHLNDVDAQAFYAALKIGDQVQVH